MIVASLIIGVIGIAVFISGVWQLLIKRAVMSNAKPYMAEFIGFETKEFGKRKKTYYSLYIPELEKQLLSVHTAFWGERKNLPKQVEVYYNEQVRLYCCIKGNHESEYFFLTSFFASVVLIAAAVLLLYV